MIYDSRRRTWGDGEWHCPFPRRWVERMARAAKACKKLSDADVAGVLDREVAYYRVPPSDFLDEEQDARGLPLSYCRKEAEKYKDWPDCCTAIYDYDSIPEMVITNGYDDWPMVRKGKVLQA